MRRAQIKLLHDDEGGPVVSHSAKASLLHSLRKLDGTVQDITPLGDISHLTASTRLDSAQAMALDAPLTMEELCASMFSMNADDAPGPDGFVPKFYQTNWNLVRQDVSRFAATFHSHSTELRRINRAFVVLIPKSDTVVHPKDYRPISLQNCLPKIVSKAMT